ncbi:hypothetical protein LTI14_10650 [Nesterenkonia sp. YGD6]|uniref:hypothetical protein n=1 Tax=Nesterenkonia sp. YGD6 TaxID=2901231 RepID=UPI001F4C933C|nr:hypothetical protein [Nesterenkonia sp. YGD6]MCH8563669.1 hypothetical protein [Nesterenkonia sp. YGD6]
MISDSVPWKEELLKVATALERRAQTARWTERTGFLVERDLMIGMYTIRRLIESAKTSSLLPREHIALGMHPLIGPVPRSYDRWSYYEYYDLDSKRQARLPVERLVNLFIHSFILEFYPPSEHGPARIWVVSDRARDKGLYSVSFERVVSLFHKVGNEDLLYVAMQGGEPWGQLSQHDFVEAGLAQYDPYPHVETPAHTYDQIVTAFPSVLGGRGQG